LTECFAAGPLEIASVKSVLNGTDFTDGKDSEPVADAVVADSVGSHV